MSYRDDHEAALERAAALERELAQANADRDRLRAELVCARTQHGPVQVFMRPHPTNGLSIAIRISVATVVLAAAVVGVAMRHEPPPGPRLPRVELVVPVDDPGTLSQAAAITRCAAETLGSDAAAYCRLELARCRARAPRQPARDRAARRPLTSRAAPTG